MGEVGAKDCVRNPEIHHDTDSYNSSKANIRTRSRITLEDLNTKHGTKVNDEQIRGKSIVLSQDQNAIIVGKCEDKLRFSFLTIPICSYLLLLGLYGFQLL